MPTCDADTIQLKGVQANSAKQARDQADRDYQQAVSDQLACQGPSAQGAAALQAAAGDITDIQKDVDVLTKVQSVILKQLNREVKSEGVITNMSDIASDETEKAQAEIEELRSTIRRERRLFLDADPSAPTSVAGLYYTREPDNQLLIAFLVCFGFFLLFVGLLIIFRLLPIQYFLNLDADVRNPSGYSERIKLVCGFWILSLFIAYMCFFTFT